jgi:hypothetical protein
MMKCHDHDVLQQIARSWNRAGYTYGVCHGLEEYPVRYGGDIDILAPPRLFKEMARDAKIIAEAAGYEVVWRQHPCGRSLQLTRGFNWDDTTELHFVRRLEWRGVLLADRVGKCERKGNFRCDMWATWVKALFLYILSDDPRTRPVMCWPQEVLRERIEYLLGKSLAKKFEPAVAAYHPALLREVRPKIRRNLFLRQFVRRPDQMLMALMRMMVRKALLPRTRFALPLVVADLAGEGSRRVCSRIANGERYCFTRVRHLRGEGELIYSSPSGQWEAKAERLQDGGALGGKPLQDLVLLSAKLARPVERSGLGRPLHLSLPWKRPRPSYVFFISDADGTDGEISAHVYFGTNGGTKTVRLDAAQEGALESFVLSVATELMFSYFRSEIYLGDLVIGFRR